MRRDFVANVSHELRTPLTVCHGYLEPARTRRPARVGAACSAIMRRQSQRMSPLVEDLLTLSRLEAGRAGRRRRGDGAMLASAEARSRGAEPGRHRVAGGDPRATPTCSASTRELHSAFSNLVSNAVRYTPAGGASRSASRATPDERRRAVGRATPATASQAAHMPRITERFYRVVQQPLARDAAAPGSAWPSSSTC